MKVLIVSQYFYPEGFRINDVIASLIKKGLEVDVLTGKPNYPEGKLFKGYESWGIKKEKIFDANIFRIPIFPRGSDSALRLFLNYISFIVSGLLIAPFLLRKKKYDIIFVYGVSPILQALPAIFIGWLKKIKVILWIQDLWPESLEATGYIKNKIILKFVKKIVKYIYKHSDLLLVQSRGFIPYVSKLAPYSKIIYYPNSVEKYYYENQNLDEILIPDINYEFNIVFAGNIGAGQAVECMVQAANIIKEYSDIHLLVFGQGSKYSWMQTEINKLGLKNIHLMGRYPSKSMPSIMRKADALLVSLSDRPIFAATVPNKVQAYLAVGKPILASLNGEGAMVVEESGAGISTAAEDSEELADAILKLYRMTEEERNTMSINGRDYFKKNFDQEMLINQLINHFNEVVKKGSDK